MKKGNLLHESHRSPDGLTKKDKKAEQPENIVNRDFTAKEANVKWLTDITQTPCRDGKLYIAVRARRFQPHLSPAEIAKNKFN